QDREIKSNRRQRVLYQGYLSDWEYPSCGVAQGTILGPIIFLALINNALQDQIRWTSHQPCTLQQTLNDPGIWVEEHKMKLNSKKCKVLHVTRMQQIPVLGVTIQSDLKWDGQVDHMLSSANRKHFALRPLKKFGVQDQELVIIYTGYMCALC
uniref:Uncharacterized protein n=1 Tax=Sinocyclocheilus rhinocerous TaxID=307959 RepID=A0A673ICZ8_9TELE